MTTARPLTELPKSYTPAEAEAGILARWDASGVSHAEPGGDGEPYSILIPPPNVTAALHLGHALNNTLQDVLIRMHRMRGFNTLWMPGTDHAGIATQTVVEKRLLVEEGKRRTDFDREAFVARVQMWKDSYEATITSQLRSMGCSCDWPRQRFTMDPMCAKAVREAFYALFADDLIYRGKRLVNWDPVTLTAIADDEVEMKEVDGHMWYLRYPLVEPVTIDGQRVEHVTVATTRPETMLGDTAVAINPSDPRAEALRGATVRLPIVDRVVPIVEDSYVVLPASLGGDPADAKSEFATGFLKVTPAHDPNDWDIGLRHDLPVINVLAPDATISADHGWDDASDEARAFLGMTREDARGAVVAWLRERDLLEKTRDYHHSVGHSYRSHVPIEPYLSDQWYVRVSDDRLVGEAQRALDPDQRTSPVPRHDDGPRSGDDELRFYPARYARTYEAWHDNLRDWCISRQLWWGHQIPVWATPENQPIDAALVEQLAAWTASERVATRTSGERTYVCIRSEDDAEAVAALEAAGLSRDPDVLDTWFSSGLWPLSTMGWPDPAAFPDTAGLLETFNPTNVLCTGRDIITLWVSRMVMFTRYFLGGSLPYRHVYINPMIQDGHGQRMSKSLGNGVDPRDIIGSHGADALRFALVQTATSTQDVRLPVDCVCPHCEKSFHPEELISPAGYRVATPRQTCPSCQKIMVTAFGVASGSALPNDDEPMALNTSSRFDLGRNFANKIWNAGRLTLSKLDAEGVPGDVNAAPETLVDRWMVTRLHRTLHAIEDAVGEYQFSGYAEAIYDLARRDFCDWYLEAIKPTIADDPVQRQVMRTVFDAILRLLHPICPFVSESLWPNLQACGNAGLDGIVLPANELLIAAAWPDIACRVDDDAALETFERIQALTNAIRNLRGEKGVKPKRRIVLHANDDISALVESAGAVVPTLAGLESVEPADPRPADAIAFAFAFEGSELWLSGLVDAVDVDAERARLEKRCDELTRSIDGYVKKLANEGYINNAPPNLVQETKDRHDQAQADLAAARTALEALGAEA